MTESSDNIAEFTVTEISSKIKRSIESEFEYVRVRGELGRISRPSSGHVYLDLKDDKSVLSGIIWKGVASRMKLQPEQGLEVIATGKITTYAGQSKYQIVIESMEPAGLGALMVQLERRRKELEAEGLFAEERKKSLPVLPMIIGVVTSPSGAVIRDILHRVQDRFPLHVLIWPVRVQGETCGEEVAKAIRGFNALSAGDAIPRPDILIVARGGGSFEDLWGFNDEIVVRAAAESDIPLVSAIGHETDWTLIDLAADVRAPTPTGAAEIAIPVRAELLASVDDLNRRLNTGLVRLLQEQRMKLRASEKALPLPRDLLALPRQRFDAVADKLGYALRSNTHIHSVRLNSIRGRLSINSLRQTVGNLRQRLDAAGLRSNRAIVQELQKKKSQLEGLSKQLSVEGLIRSISGNWNQFSSLRDRMHRSITDQVSRRSNLLESKSKLLLTLSYQNTLDRGFALIRDENEIPVRLASSVSSNQELSVQFADGRIGVVSKDGANQSGETKNPEVQPNTGSESDGNADDRQESLF